MQRYFTMNEDIDLMNNRIALNQEQWHHIAKVMRAKENEEIICINRKDGKSYHCLINNLKENSVTILNELNENNELSVIINLFYGMPKYDKFELVIQKATELGVSNIIPLDLRRCQVKNLSETFNKKKERYNKITMEACEQSHRNKIPHLYDVRKLKAINEFKADINIVAYEEDAKNGENTNLKKQLALLKKNAVINLVVGPEGGFDLDEINELKEIGYTTCSLGKRILRSETAPLYLLSLIGFYDELK